MKKYLGNAFSLQMVQEAHYEVQVDEISKKDFREEVYTTVYYGEDGSYNIDPSSIYAVAMDELNSEITSVIGHADTAKILHVPFNRVSVQLHRGDILYVAQVVGGRLPEGTTKLPEGFSMKFFKVTIK